MDMDPQQDLSTGISTPSYILQRIPPPITFSLLDDWTGITDPKERKKVQNRLNQRECRRRQRCILENLENQEQLSAAPTSHPGISLAHFASLRDLYNLGFTSEQAKRTLRQLEGIIYQSSVGSPRTDLLLGLTQLNLVRAFFFNIEILGYTSAQMYDDALSPFCIVGPSHISREADSLPLSLQPTAVQCRTPHHPWLDLFPFPKLRDNLIAVESLLDDFGLCHDLCGHRTSTDGTSGILVWKDPWDPAGWEVTESFAFEWGWAIKDCWDLFQSTNYWRRKRGQKPLFHR